MDKAEKIDRPEVARRRMNLANWIEFEHNNSQASFIELTGINQGELSALLKDKSFGEKKARKLEEQAGMPTGYLDGVLSGGMSAEPDFSLTRPSSMVVRELEPQQYSSEASYPRIVGTAQMGNNGYYEDLEGGDGYLEVKAANGAIAIRVRGDSMYPAIRDGWYVVIEPDSLPQIGEYVLISFKDGKKMVKELMQEKDDCYILLSVNGEQRITAMKEFIEQFRAISMVVPPSKYREFI